MASLLVLSVPASPTQAAQSVSDGDVEIHYTSFSSLLIPPDVAALHNIARAKNRIVVNVSARRGEQPVRLDITGKVTNLLEQTNDLEFTEVREAEAVYYLANHIALEQDILRFLLTVSSGGDDPITIKFLRRYD